MAHKEQAGPFRRNGTAAGKVLSDPKSTYVPHGGSDGSKQIEVEVTYQVEGAAWTKLGSYTQ